MPVMATHDYTLILISAIKIHCLYLKSAALLNLRLKKLKKVIIIIIINVIFHLNIKHFVKKKIA